MAAVLIFRSVIRKAIVGKIGVANLVLPRMSAVRKRHTNYQNVLREIRFNSGRIVDALKDAGI